MVEPQLFKAMLEELADQDLYRKAIDRLLVTVLAVDKRENNAVYQSALSRR
jgi:hypothetical protein